MALKQVEIQNPYKAKVSERDLITLDLQTDFSPTRPLLHKESRFLYVLSGQAKIKIQNKIYTMEEGDLLALNPWQISEIIEVDDHISYYLLIYKYELFNYQIKNHINLNSEDFPFLETLYRINKVQVPQSLRSEILNIFQSLRDEVGLCSLDVNLSKKNYSDIFVFAKISELLVYFLRLSERSEEEFEEDEFFSEQILSYMFLNLKEDLSLARLSKIFYMSESAISTYIKSLTGMGFYELIQSMKILKIEFLLVYTNLTLEEIASLLNFTDGAQVSKVFQTHTGVQANKFRKANQAYTKFLNTKLDQRAVKILEYIYDNYEGDLDILEVSELFDTSPQNINKILKYYVEENFSSLLSTLRIKKACQLLTDTDIPVGEIALRVGFNNQKTFLRNFQRQTTMTPSDFRSFAKGKEK
ncbi:AraC family transcriptional regulator [Neofamilia massiliensis]|uniref:AraC family transcriptional regulator n=1 Tax=Neofamilia massiliensis TaxID=1673724 RepID=UPI0006BB8E9C|nr:AraC family transcriptional regulator [Neofamilia massiliensis]